MYENPREQLRALVRSRVLAGWYSHAAADGTLRWVLVHREPKSTGEHSETLTGEELRAYLRKGHLAR